MLESLFNKVANLKACSFIKKRLQHRCFPVNIAKFLRIAFFIEHFRRLLLTNEKYANEKYTNEKNTNENYTNEKYRNKKYTKEKYANGKYTN